MAKKKSLKKAGLTVGSLFGRMFKEAAFYEHMVYSSSENPWDMEFIGFTQIDDCLFHIDDKTVVVDDVLTCNASHPVVVKGDTAEIKIGDYTYLFRFYSAPNRIDLRPSLGGDSSAQNPGG